MPSHFPLVPLLVCFPNAEFSFILYESLWIKLFEIKFVIRHLRFSILRMRFAFLRDFIPVDLLKTCTIKPGPREFKIILKFLKKNDKRWKMIIQNHIKSTYKLLWVKFKPIWVTNWSCRQCIKFLFHNIQWLWMYTLDNNKLNHNTPFSVARFFSFSFIYPIFTLMAERHNINNAHTHTQSFTNICSSSSYSLNFLFFLRFFLCILPIVINKMAAHVK